MSDPEGAGRPETGGGAPAKNISMIVVDDDAAIVRLLGKVFAGVRSFAAFGSAADFLAGAKLDDCDIVITDINMPGGQSGIELTSRVKLSAPQCDVVVMTGEATLDNALAAMKAGAYDFIKKPFTVDYVESVVSRCMEKRAISSELALLRSAQQELSAAYSQLKSSERMKDAFLAVIGHELRTPLAKIMAGADLLGTELSGQQAEILRMVSAGAADLHGAIEAVILYSDMSKENAPRVRAPADLNAAAAEVVAELSARAAAAGVTLTLRAAAGQAEVVGDPKGLQGAIRRLVQNAITYNVRGGAAEVSLLADADSVSVTVSDSGIGIPAELVAGLGTPFYQIADHMTRRTGGLGLGLAIVKQVVEAHCGKMSVKSAGGSGTAFTVTFPRIPPAERSRAPAGK